MEPESTVSNSDYTNIAELFLLEQHTKRRYSKWTSAGRAR
jgi:hypothetical protein